MTPKQIARLFVPYLPGTRVRAVKRIVYEHAADAPKIAKGEIGTMVRPNVRGLRSLGLVRWDSGPQQPTAYDLIEQLEAK